MLVEKNTLEKEFGGFSYFLKYLAEDYMMGRKYEKRGLKVSTNFTWVTNINSDSTIKSFFSRMTRWNTMRYNIDLKYYLAEVIFLNPVIYSVFAILTFNKVLVISGIATILFKLSAEFISIYSLNRTDMRNAFNIIRFIPAFFLKEAVLFIAFLIPFFSKTVNWRGRNIKVGKNSIINYDDAGNVQFADEI
jgi:ceramide glucosyltransferase